VRHQFECARPGRNRSGDDRGIRRGPASDDMIDAALAPPDLVRGRAGGPDDRMERRRPRMARVERDPLALAHRDLRHDARTFDVESLGGVGRCRRVRSGVEIQTRRRDVGDVARDRDRQDDLGGDQRTKRKPAQASHVRC
jgi:hypothetical protein